MEFKEAIKRSTIPRINWKGLLFGMSMGKFVQTRTNQGISKEDIIVEILKLCKRDNSYLYLEGWDWEDIVKNVEIGVSARLAEIKSYGGKNGSK